jgi:hypothetical protein
MDTPSYWAVLPSNIRYAKDLTLLQKVLFAEITALSNKEGYCWASNDYFANLYDKNSDYISTTINDMAKKGYIIVHIENFNQRKIWARVEENLEGGLEKPKGGLEKPKSPPLEKSKHNNININNINNNRESSLPPTKRKFSSIKDIDENCIQEIAIKLNTTKDLVLDSWDTAQNWLSANGKVKKDYKAFLTNWVKSDLKNKDKNSTKFQKRGGYVEIFD